MWKKIRIADILVFKILNFQKILLEHEEKKSAMRIFSLQICQFSKNFAWKFWKENPHCGFLVPQQFQHQQLLLDTVEKKIRIADSHV